MNNQNNKKIRRALPFFVEFLKFSAGFSLIIVLALIALRVVSSVNAK